MQTNIGKRTYCQMSTPVATTVDSANTGGENGGEGSEGGGGETASVEEDEEASSLSLRTAIRKKIEGPFTIYKVRRYCALSSQKLQEAKTYAENNHGKCLSTITTEDNMISFACSLGHIFKLPIDRNSGWCSKCDNILKELKNFAQKNLGMIHNSYVSKCMTMRCKRGHEWSIEIK